MVVAETNTILEVSQRVLDREAECFYCKRTAQSHPDLDLYEYQGEGSEYASRRCRECGYPEGRHRDFSHSFEGGRERRRDTYYCGCRG